MQREPTGQLVGEGLGDDEDLRDALAQARQLGERPAGAGLVEEREGLVEEDELLVLPVRSSSCWDSASRRASMI